MSRTPSKVLRLVLLVSILASFVAFLDGSVVNVALPAIARELGGGLSIQQWVIDAYLITLGGLILVAGSLSDIFGRKLILRWGLIGFAATSLLCALAPSGAFLIVMRVLQGVAGALLVPSSLALIISSFPPDKQGKAIGKWTAWTGIAYILGPLLGGLLVDVYSWRLVFIINIVPVAVTLWLMRALRDIDEPSVEATVDITGALLCAFGLGGVVYALIEQAHYGWANPQIYLPLLVGLAALAVFVWHERRTAKPMLPLKLFTVRNFSVGNVATAAIYAGLSVSSFLVIVFLQQVAGYSAVGAGFALLPVTLLMFVFSSRFGALAGKYGPRLFMTIGPLIAAAGFLSFLLVQTPVEYVTQLLPGVLLFGFGLSITVAPLTTAILGSIHHSQAGVGSAINNAVARIAGLLAVAGIGIVVGQVVTLAGFRRGVIVMAVLLIVGAVVSGIGIQNSVPRGDH